MIDDNDQEYHTMDGIFNVQTRDSQLSYNNI